MDLHLLIKQEGGFKRAARLTLQLPHNSRFVTKLDPSLSWGWDDLFRMMMTHSLRQLVWSKTKDAHKKVPTKAPEIIGPEYILAQWKHAEKAKDRVGSRKWTPNARVFDTTEELDAYLKRPRKPAAAQKAPNTQSK